MRESKFIFTSRGELAKEKNILLCKKKKKKESMTDRWDEEKEVPFWDTVCGCYAFSNARFELSYETVRSIYRSFCGFKFVKKSEEEEEEEIRMKKGGNEKQDNGCCRYAQERDFFIIPKR